MEGAVTGLAALRSTDADNNKLLLLIAEAAEKCEKGLDRWNDFVQVDDRIHTEIARIAGNPLYTFVLHSIHQNIFRYYDKFLAVGETEMDENFQDLRLMVEAIVDSDADTARRMAVEHVRRFSRYMENRKRQNLEL